MRTLKTEMEKGYIHVWGHTGDIVICIYVFVHTITPTYPLNTYIIPYSFTPLSGFQVQQWSEPTVGSFCGAGFKGLVIIYDVYIINKR